MTEVPAEHQRSGADVADAVGEAERGAALPETHTHPERTKSGEAPVEQSYGDQAMTEGRAEPPSAGTEPLPSGPSPADAGSGGAQSEVGARVSDRLAGGEPRPDGAPFEPEADPEG